MKKGLIIGASSESIFGIETAKKMGINVSAFDGDESAKGLEYAEEAFVTDIRNPKNIIEIIGKEKPDVVIPIPIGRYLISGAAINDYYGLKGISKDAAELCTDKYEFHKKLSEHGLRSGDCVLIEEGMDCTLIDYSIVSYPVILKPRYGSGSRSVGCYSSEAELKDAFKNQKYAGEDFVLESAFEGTEYGIDGAVIDGKLYLVLIREKLLTDFPARQCVGYISITEKNDFTEGMYNYIAKITEILGMNNTIFHADIMYSESEYFAVEISGRPSGHRLHDVFTPLVTGVNMIEQYLKFALDSEYSFEIDKRRKMMIRFFDFSDCEILSIPDEKEIEKLGFVERYECNIKKNQWMQKVVDGHSIMGRGFFIVNGCDKDEMISRSNKVLEMFEKK